MRRSNWQEFDNVLNRYGITKLYHFTDRANLNSIIQNGGLLSWGDCLERGISIEKAGGGGPGSLSWSLDKRRGLQNYVRVSFTQHHPMMYVAINEGRIKDYVLLEIDPEVIFWEESLYSNMNATRNEANIGGSLEDFKQIHFSSVKKLNHFMLMSEEQPYFQAEILVKNHIPLRYIKNIGDFRMELQSGVEVKQPIYRATTPDRVISELWENGQINDAILMAGSGRIPEEHSKSFIEEYIGRCRYRTNYQREVNINNRTFKYLQSNGDYLKIVAKDGNYNVHVFCNNYQAIYSFSECELEETLILKGFPQELRVEIGFLCQKNYNERMAMGVIIQVLAHCDTMSDKFSAAVKTIMESYLFLPRRFEQEICYFTPEQVDGILNGMSMEKKRYLFVLMSKLLILPLSSTSSNILDLVSSKRLRVSTELVKKYNLPQCPN